MSRAEMPERFAAGVATVVAIVAPTSRRFGATISAPSSGGGCVRAPWVRWAPSTAALLPRSLCPESAAGAPLTAGVVSMLGSVDDRLTSPADVRPMTVRRRVALAGHPTDEHLVRSPRVPVWPLLGSLLSQRTEHALDGTVKPRSRGGADAEGCQGEELPGAGPRRRPRRGRYIGDVGAGDGAARRAVQGRPGVGEDDGLVYGVTAPYRGQVDPLPHPRACLRRAGSRRAIPSRGITSRAPYARFASLRGRGGRRPGERRGRGHQDAHVLRDNRESRCV